MKIIFSLLALLLLSTSANAMLEERRALIIGNANYSSLPVLRNPENDAKLLSRALRALDFTVDVLLDGSAAEMRESLERFQQSLLPNSVALIYYAGHGVQNDGQNYLIPTDVDIRQSWQLQESTISLKSILQGLDASSAALRIVMLDACRNNPLKDKSNLARSMRSRSGLAQTGSAAGTIVSYATQPDNIALDGSSGNSPYTAALVKRLPTPGISVTDMLNEVGNDVLRATGSQQQPWQSSSPIPRFCFADCDRRSNISPQLALADLVADSLRLRDIGRLTNSLQLTEEQARRAELLFLEYDSLTVSSEIIEQNEAIKSAGIASARITIDSGRSSVGLFAVPAKEWGTLELLLTERQGQWDISGFTGSLFSEAATSADAIDLRPPRISLEQRDLIDTGRERLRIKAVIQDDAEIQAAAVYYRADSRERFKSAPMVPEGQASGYSASINLTRLAGNNIEIYVEAVDSSGNRARYPDATDALVFRTDSVSDSSAAPQPAQTSPSRRWVYIGLGILAAGAVAAAASGSGSGSGSGTDGGDPRNVLITTPLP